MRKVIYHGLCLIRTFTLESFSCCRTYSPNSKVCRSPSRLLTAPTGEQIPKEKSEAHTSVWPPSLRNIAVSATVSLPDIRRHKQSPTLMGDLVFKHLEYKDPSHWNLAFAWLWDVCGLLSRDFTQLCRTASTIVLILLLSTPFN